MTRNLQRIEKRQRLTTRMLEAIQHRLQIIPRRRSDNPLQQLAWTVANLDKRAREQRRSNIEIRGRIRELEILREGPPVRWHAQMERMQREVRPQIEQSKEMLALAGDLSPKQRSIPKNESTGSLVRKMCRAGVGPICAPDCVR